MKRRVLIFSSMILIITLFLTFFSQGATDEFGQEIISDSSEEKRDTLEVETLSTDSEVEGLEVTPAQEATETEQATPTTYDVTNVEQDLTVTTIPDNIAIETTQGTISSFSMTNALFSLGSLIQGSFISFSNNNNLFFSSIFDASEFTATLDEGGSVEVGQRNSFGDMGKVVVQIDGGNLTQDNKLTFIPNSNSATYTYYNTTEIEFKDGNLTYYSESITNKENRESTTASFDEKGFTKIKLLPNEQYTNGDFSLLNTETNPLIICKEDPLCDINIDQETFTVKGKVNVSSKGNLIYQSKDKNNEAILDFTTGTFTLNNPLPEQETLSIFSNGHVQLTETQNEIYFLPQINVSSNNFKTYTSLLHGKTLSLEDNTVAYQNFSAFLPESSLYQSCLEHKESCILQKEEPVQKAPEKKASSSYYYLGAFLFMLLVVFFLFPQRKKKYKKGQFTLFITLGFVLLIVVILLLVAYNPKSTATTITEIQSLEQAREVVESCITEKIQESITALGEYGGYTTANQYTFSQFNTSYELLSLDALQGNLQTGMERSLSDCTNILNNTPYTLTHNGRIHIQVEFGEEIKITGDSLGIITRSEGTQSTTVGEIKQSKSINMPEIAGIAQEVMQAQEGIPVISPETYALQIFVNTAYEEMLIEIQQENPQFTFRITKSI